MYISHGVNVSKALQAGQCVCRSLRVGKKVGKYSGIYFFSCGHKQYHAARLALETMNAPRVFLSKLSFLKLFFSHSNQNMRQFLLCLFYGLKNPKALHVSEAGIDTNIMGPFTVQGFMKTAVIRGPLFQSFKRQKSQL